MKNIKKKNKFSFYIKRYPLFKILSIYVDFCTYIYCLIFKPDIYHETYYHKNKFKIYSKLKILTIYDLIHEKFKKNYNNEKILNKKKIIKYFDHFICISKNTQKDFINYYNVPRKKTSVIYLSGEHIKKTAVKKLYNLTKNYFLYVGNRENYKNFKVLVSAVNKSNFFENYQIICFGGGAFTKYEFSSFKNREKFIFIEGNDSHLKYLYSNSKGLIITSLYEGFGLTGLEAMELGCPVISSDRGSLKEVYKDAAIYFDPNKSNDLIKKVKYLTSSKKVKNKIINKGYKRCKYFTWKKCSNKTNQLYKKLLDKM